VKKAVILLIAALLPLLATPSHAEDSKSPKAEETATRFYRAYLKLNTRGLPTEKEMETFAPLFGTELTGLIAAARREQQKFIKEHPGDKPPWCDGNLFASNYEGVSSFKLGTPTFTNDKASIPVYLEYREGTSVGRWIDVIILVRFNDEWRVWDIFMNAPWSFRSGPNLRSILSLE
jgi:hypothetical protein